LLFSLTHTPGHTSCFNWPVTFFLGNLPICSLPQLGAIFRNCHKDVYLPRPSTFQTALELNVNLTESSTSLKVPEGRDKLYVHCSSV
jgi:hypothetical protein